MVPQKGFPQEPEWSVFILVFSIFLIGSSIYFEGIDGILRVDSFAETTIFVTGIVFALMAIGSLVWIASR